MDLEILQNYIEKIYGYAIKHTTPAMKRMILHKKYCLQLLLNFQNLKLPIRLNHGCGASRETLQNHFAAKWENDARYILLILWKIYAI